MCKDRIALESSVIAEFHGFLELEGVARFLEKGADVCSSRNGATALLLMVLNPYTSYEEMAKISRMVIEKEPRVVCARDGFKMTAFEPRTC